MSNVAIFPVSTEEDLLFELVFPSVDLSARSFRIEVRERSSATVKATLTIGAGLTLIGTDRIRTRVAKASLASWTQNIEYTADLVETTGSVNTTLVQVRVQYYQPGRLPGSASLGNAATIQITDNTATVISYSGPAVNIGAALAENVEVTPAGGISATNAQAALEELDAEKAPKASPTFTGEPAAPTAAPGTSTTQLATTAFAAALGATKAPLDSPALTGTPTAPTAAPTTNNTQIATTAMVQAAIAAYLAASDVMVLKGGLSAAANPNYPAADAGHTYRITVTGKIGGASGAPVEAGDTIICIADGSAAGNQATVGANWIIIQANIDGAVIGPASATDGHFAQFDGATGKLIKGGLALDTDGTMAADSDTRVPPQKAVRAYADGKVAKSGDTMTDALKILGSVTTRLMIGYGTAVNVGSTSGQTVNVQVHGTDAGTAQAGVYRWANSNGGATFSVVKSRGTAAGTRGLVQDGDIIGSFQFWGDDGTHFPPAAVIQVQVDGVAAAGVMPGRILFLTAAAGGGGAVERMRVDNAGLVTPGGDNTQKFGSASFRWSEVFAGTGTINTSDAVEKHWIGALSVEELRVARRLSASMGMYQWKDSIAAKGDSARRHIGVTAQDVAAAFAAESLDPAAYAIWCQDEVFEDRASLRIGVREKLGEDGQIIVDADGAPVMDEFEEEVVERVATGRFRQGIRYDQLYAFVTAAALAEMRVLAEKIAALQVE